jgi:hypothetical protein
MQRLRNVFGVASLVLVASFGAVRAQEKKDARPTDVIVGFMTALVRGDADGLRARAHVEGEEAKTVIGWLADIAKAGAEVRKAAEARFGAEGGKQIDALQPFEANEIRHFNEKIDGDAAVVHLGNPEGNAPLALKKVDGVWKLNVAEIIKQEEWAPANISKLSSGATKRLGKLKERIEKGDVTSAEAAAKEMLSAALGEDESGGEEGL